MCLKQQFKGSDILITKRIIPCLDIRDGRVVKGVNFKNIKDIDDPIELAAFYNNSGADELVFYDITASFEGRKLFTGILSEVASRVFIPPTTDIIQTVSILRKVSGGFFLWHCVNVFFNFSHQFFYIFFCFVFKPKIIVYIQSLYQVAKVRYRSP